MVSRKAWASQWSISRRLIARLQITWPMFSILFQISLDDKNALAIIGHGELLRASDALQALQTTVLGKHDVHLKAITDLDEIKLALG